MATAHAIPRRVARRAAAPDGPAAQGLEEPRRALPSRGVEGGVVESLPGDLKVDEPGGGKFDHEPHVLLAEGGQLGNDQVPSPTVGRRPAGWQP